jgi:hypothetical protein
MAGQMLGPNETRSTCSSSGCRPGVNAPGLIAPVPTLDVTGSRIGWWLAQEYPRMFIMGVKSQVKAQELVIR